MPGRKYIRIENTRRAVALAVAIASAAIAAACTTDDGKGAPAKACARPPCRVEDAGITPEVEASTTCAADTDCPATQHCRRGLCVDDVCQPDEATCDSSGSAVLLCSPAGDQKIRLRCSTGETCAAEGGPARCSNWVCMPGTTSCDAKQQLVRRCASNGLSTDVVEDCSKTSKACANGECKDIVCEPSKTYCDGAAVYSCGADGTSRTLVRECNTLEFCDAATATCLPQVCTPKSRNCDQDKPRQCLDDGSAWKALDACADKQLCVDGACKDVVCTPNQNFCGPTDVRQCSADGTSFSFVQTCPTDTHCAVGSNGPYCATNFCAPNAAICRDNMLTTCKADGSGPAPGGTDCGTDKKCVTDACKTKVCTSNATVCKNNGVYTCDDTGTVLTQIYACGTDTYCDPNAGLCVPRVCAAGTYGCDGEAYGACNDEGSAFTASPTNCKTTNKICTMGGCDATAVDLMGNDSTYEQPFQGNFYGNVIDVKTARTLTQIEMDMSITADVALTWMVFDGQGGLIASQATTSTTSTQFQSSGTMSVPLLAGNTYLIGLFHVPVGSIDYVIHSPANSTPQPVSFGVVLGAAYGQSESVPDVVYASVLPSLGIFYERLTTVPPG